MKQIAVRFPNKKTFYLYPERNTICKYGLDFPYEIGNRTLFLTGNSGTGKTTLVENLCKYENMTYPGQRFITFNTFKDRAGHKSLSDFLPEKVIDGHFTFLGFSEKKPCFVHDRKIIYPLDYSSLTLNGDVPLDSLVKENFIFEFRLFKPRDIKKARINRYKQEERKNCVGHTIYKDQRKKNILKEEYLLVQAAHKLFAEGADVYIRTSFNGIPWRFSE